MVIRKKQSKYWLTPNNLAWGVAAVAILGTIYYFASPNESIRPHVRYTMGGREFIWNGPAQPDISACIDEAYQKRREILTGTGTQVTYHGCATFNGNEIASYNPPR